MEKAIGRKTAVGFCSRGPTRVVGVRHETVVLLRRHQQTVCVSEIGPLLTTQRTIWGLRHFAVAFLNPESASVFDVLSGCTILQEMRIAIYLLLDFRRRCPHNFFFFFSKQRLITLIICYKRTKAITISLWTRWWERWLCFLIVHRNGIKHCAFCLLQADDSLLRTRFQAAVSLHRLPCGDVWGGCIN